MMLKSTLEGRIYFFACNMLWDVLSLFHYLDEDVAKQRIGPLHLTWSTQFADLANWALEERYLPN